MNELLNDLHYEVKDLEGNVLILERLQAEETAKKEEAIAGGNYTRADIHGNSVSWYEAKLMVYKERIERLKKIISRYE